MQVCHESRHTSRPCIIDLLYHPIATKCSSPAFTYVQEFGNTMDLIWRRKTKAKSCSQAVRHSVCEWNEEGKIWDEFERVYFRNFFLKLMILEITSFPLRFLKTWIKIAQTLPPTSYQPNLTSPNLSIDNFEDIFKQLDQTLDLRFHLTSSQSVSQTWKTFRARSASVARVITCVSWSLQWCMQQSMHFFLFTKKSQARSLRDYRQTRSLSRPNPRLFGVTVAIPPFIRFSRPLAYGGRVYPRWNCIFPSSRIIN